VLKFTVVLMRGIFELLGVVIWNELLGELHVAEGFW
jgi:hypothetical protein